MPGPVRLGDRFRTTRSSEVHVIYVQYAPSHTVGGKAQLPAGTTVVALDQAPNATAFYAYPEAYDELAPVLVPESESSSYGYASAYGLSFQLDDIGDLLEPLTPMGPRPTQNRLPQVGH
jgi:hypothetical protein